MKKYLSKTGDWVKKSIYLYGPVMDNWSGVGGVPDPKSESGHPIADVLMRVLMWLLGIFGFLALIAFIIAGVLYLTAQGDYRKIEQAKKATYYAIIGIVIGLIGLIVVRTIDSLLRGTNY